MSQIIGIDIPPWDGGVSLVSLGYLLNPSTARIKYPIGYPSPSIAGFRTRRIMLEERLIGQDGHRGSSAMPSILKQC